MSHETTATRSFVTDMIAEHAAGGGHLTAEDRAKLVSLTNGADGADGASVTIVGDPVVSDEPGGVSTVVLHDGARDENFEITVRNGLDGRDGQDGRDGAVSWDDLSQEDKEALKAELRGERGPGVTVQSAQVSADPGGTSVVELHDESTGQTTRIEIRNGLDGQRGADGTVAFSDLSEAQRESLQGKSVYVVGSTSSDVPGGSSTVVIHDERTNQDVTLSARNGVDGATPVIEVGEVSSGAEPSVSAAADDGSVKLNFVLPKGDKGEDGAVSWGDLSAEDKAALKAELKGVTPAISVNSVTTVAPNLDASVEVDPSGTAESVKLNFSIPRGYDGADGADGDDGVPGERGSKWFAGTASFPRAQSGSRQVFSEWQYEALPGAWTGACYFDAEYHDGAWHFSNPDNQSIDVSGGEDAVELTFSAHDVNGSFFEDAVSATRSVSSELVYMTVGDGQPVYTFSDSSQNDVFLEGDMYMQSADHAFYRCIEAALDEGDLEDRHPSYWVRVFTAEDGFMPRVAVGTVTTGDPGSSAAVSAENDNGTVVFDFTVPRGATGAPGGYAVASSLDSMVNRSSVWLEFPSGVSDFEFPLPSVETGQALQYVVYLSVPASSLVRVGSVALNTLRLGGYSVFTDGDHNSVLADLSPSVDTTVEFSVSQMGDSSNLLVRKTLVGQAYGPIAP